MIRNWMKMAAVLPSYRLVRSVRAYKRNEHLPVQARFCVTMAVGVPQTRRSSLASVATPKPAIHGHLKTGHFQRREDGVFYFDTCR